MNALGITHMSVSLLVALWPAYASYGRLISSSLVICCVLAGFTCSVCIRDQREAFLVKPRFPESFQYLTMDISDHEVRRLLKSTLMFSNPLWLTVTTNLVPRRTRTSSESCLS
jgi:hypothetical protein